MVFETFDYRTEVMPLIRLDPDGKIIALDSEAEVDKGGTLVRLFNEPDRSPAGLHQTALDLFFAYYSRLFSASNVLRPILDLRDTERLERVVGPRMMDQVRAALSRAGIAHFEP